MIPDNGRIVPHHVCGRDNVCRTEARALIASRAGAVWRVLRPYVHRPPTPCIGGDGPIIAPRWIVGTRWVIPARAVDVGTRGRRAAARALIAARAGTASMETRAGTESVARAAALQRRSPCMRGRARAVHRRRGIPPVGATTSVACDRDIDRIENECPPPRPWARRRP